MLIGLCVCAFGVTLFPTACGGSDQEDNLTEPEPGTISQGPIEGMSFAWIPSGCYMMGSPSSEQGHMPNESPLHNVDITGFEIMCTEVTQSVWEEVMGTTIYDLREQMYRYYDYTPTRPQYYGEGPQYPVYYVNWYNCQEFADALNARDSVYYYRLPSESEWEYACRAASTTAYYWGERMDGNYCWYTGNAGLESQSERQCRPVGQSVPNAWGVYDMSGNVSEWCDDWYHDDYIGAPSDGSSWITPTGTKRVVRGGAWDYIPEGCRSAKRIGGGGGGVDPEYGGIYSGFRLVRTRR